MNNILELEPYGKQGWDSYWNKNNFKTTCLMPCSLGDKISKDKIPIHLIERRISYSEINKIISFYFPKTKFFLPSRLAKHIKRIINSLILKKVINKIEKDKGIKFDIILLHYCYGTNTPYFLNKNKTFFYIHGTLSKTWLYKTTIKKAKTRIALMNENLICCSKASYDDIKNLNMAPESLNFVLNGIPISTAKKMGMAKMPNKYGEEDYIVFFGRLSAEKQIPQMIKAYVKSKIPAKFIIVGDGVEHQRTKECIKDLNCGNNVILYGRDENPYRWFKNAKFSIIFSSNEGAPRTIPESLAVGTPVIMSDQGGCKEYYRDCPELQKYIIDYQSTDLLAIAIKEMYNNPPKIDDKLQNQYSYENHIDCLIEIFKDRDLIKDYKERQKLRKK